MSEEEDLLEQEKDAKLMEIVEALSELSENRIANQLFKTIEKKLEFVELPDWEYHQICETFPKCDLRTMVYCCAPTNPCPYRAAVLRKIGLTLKDYIDIKKELSRDLKAILGTYENGEDKSE